MPVASSSRRSGTRRLARTSSDHIEDASQHERHADEDVEEEQDGDREDEMDVDEQQQRRIATKGRSAALVKPSKQSQPTIDVEDFRDQPLEKKDGQKIPGMAADWDAVSRKVKDFAFALVTDVAASMAEMGDGEEAEKALTQLDLAMRDLIDTQIEMKSHANVLNELHQSIARGDAVDNAVQRYQETVETKISQYMKKTSRQKYGKDEQYSKYKNRVFEAQNPGVPMPPVAEVIPREEGDESDDDEDILVGGMTQDFKCPITLTTLVDPLTSEVCGHSFSGSAIRDYLGANRNVAKKCPAAGCNKGLKLSDLKADKELEKRAKAAARRVAQKDDDSDEEEDEDEVVE